MHHWYKERTIAWASFNIEMRGDFRGKKKTNIHGLPHMLSTSVLLHTTHKNDITISITYSLCILSWKLDMK